jgi:hypothetical protein
VKLYPTSTIRSQWYDRNVVTRGMSYAAAAVAPHADTARWSYTVPASKKFQLNTSTISAQRDTAGTTGVALAYINLTTASAVTTKQLVVQHFNGGTGTYETKPLGQSMMLMPTELIEGRTVDASVGGSMSYTIDATGSEFDA